jgi:hypothetical protein
MKTYTSVRPVDTNNPIVFAFDVSSNVAAFELSLLGKNEYIPFTLSIDTNINTDSITEIIDNNISQSTTHEDSTFCGEKVIIETNETESGIPVDNEGVITYITPQLLDKEDGYYIFSNTLDELVTGNLMFFLTDNPTTSNTVNNELGSFELKNPDAHEITAYIISFEDDNPILESNNNGVISFILLGHEATRYFEKCPTTIYKKDINNVETFEYQTSENIIKAPYRGRFVISNNGRIISFSIYNTKTKNWDIVKSLIFDIAKLKGEYKLVFSVNDPSLISNITANF